jgi:short-subunit dehydrogenase
MDPSGRVALVTGASRGLGVHIARTLAGQNMRVALAARTAEGLEKLRAELVAAGKTAIAVPVDVGDASSIEGLVRKVEAELGPIDVLVNNAGIEQVERYDLLAPRAIEQAIAINLTAPMLLTRLVLPGMIARRRGHIVNIASLAGLAGTPYAETYSATKHGLVGFTRALRGTLKGEGHAVGVTVVCPGFIDDAGMYYEMQRNHGVIAPATFGTSPPDDVAEAVLTALRTNPPEIVVNRRPVRPLLVAIAARPEFAEWLGEKTGVIAFFKRVTDARRSAT